MKLLYFIITGVILLSSCKNDKEVYSPLGHKSSVHQVKVKEVIQGGGYTYLFVTENNVDYWMAVGKTETEKGKIVYYENALLMNNFKSEELDRVFEEILLVQNISDSPQISKSVPKDSVHLTGTKDAALKEEIKVEPAAGGITIGELYKNRTIYGNKKVLVRGQVVKINKNIMDRNWVHLKDGTSNAGKSDLTFTTLAEVKVGEIVTLEGIVAIDKEYGAGYVYPLIVENATLSPELDN